MIFHLGFELPKPVSNELNHETTALTDAEIKIIKTQIRKNSHCIHDYVERLDLLVNKERYPRRAVFIEKIRRRMFLLMEENDTFRKVLWRHFQTEEVVVNAETR